MAYGYSTELRARALASLDSGMACKKVAEIFQVSTRTLYNWCKRWEETGSIACTPPPKVRTTRKLTKEKLEAYIAEYPDHYLKEIGEAFGVTAQSVFGALKKFRISRKKNDKVLRARRTKETIILSRDRKNRA
jgi:transposase